jgi:hypothetical protein
VHAARTLTQQLDVPLTEERLVSHRTRNGDVDAVRLALIAKAFVE